MSADDLIASLCAEGRVDSHGGFTLDPERAREKLRTFQIAEPHRYALHLVALAVLRGATAIAFEIDSDDLWARFDGAPLGADELEDLYSSSFAAAQTDAERSRQQLAVAINAALALNPRYVRVTSGPAGARVRLEVRHGAEDAIASVDEDGSGTVIHVKQRFRPGLVVRFVKHVFGDIPEATCLRERCRHAPIPITINGRSIIEAGIEPGLHFVHELNDDEGRRCVGGLVDAFAGARQVRLVRHGVWIATVSAPHLPEGALALVRDDGLQTDLSGQEVVQGEGRERCLALAERTIEAATIAFLRERAAGGLDAWVRARLRPSWRTWKRVHDPTTPIGRAFAALPWFSDIVGRPVALAALHASRERLGAAFYSTGAFAGRIEDFPDTVVALPPLPNGDPHEDLPVLREVFGERLRDRTRDLEHALRRAARQRLWRARPATPVLDGGRHVALAPIRVEGEGRMIEGQVGLRAPGGPAAVRVIVDGHLLCELELELPLPIDAALAGVLPDLEFEGPSRDEALALAALAVLDGALWLVEEDLSKRPCHDLDPGRLALARRYLRLRHDPEQPRGWLRAFGIRDKVAEAVMAGPQAAALPRICRARGGAPLARLHEPWLAECARLPTLCGGSLSLGALALALARGDRIAWTAEEAPALPSLARIVLRLDDEETRALATTVLADQLHELAPGELQGLIAEHAFLARPVEEATLPHGACGAEVRIEEGPLRAVLGVMSFHDGEPLRAEVRVFVRGRRIETRAIWAPFAGVIAVVRDDRLRPTPDFRGIVADAAWEEVERALLRALPRLVAEALRRMPRAVIGDVLTASFPSIALRRAWEQLVAAEGPTTGENSYELLLGLASQVPLARLDEVIRAALRRPPRLVGSRRVPAITALWQIADEAGGRLDAGRALEIVGVLRQIRSACGQHRPGEPLHQQVAGAERHLLAEIRLRRVDGSGVTLAELADERVSARGIPIIRLTELEFRDAPDPRAVVVTEADEDLLVRFLGAAALTRGTSEPSRSSGLPRVTPPRDALAVVMVEGDDVAGALWVPAGVEEDVCRVVLHDASGQPLRKVSLVPPLPLAGALSGPGLRREAGGVELSLAALTAVHTAALRLYDGLLRRDDPPTLQTIHRVVARIGDGRLPAALGGLPERLRARAAASSFAPAAPVSEVRSALAEVFAELEAAAQSQAASGESREHAGRPPVCAAPPPATPEARLLAAIRAELRVLREGHERLLSGFDLEHVRLAALGRRAEPVAVGGEAVVIAGGHPLIQQAAAAAPHDRMWVDILASLVFTAVNVWRQEITDEDEALFHRLHLARLVRQFQR